MNHPLANKELSDAMFHKMFYEWDILWQTEMVSIWCDTYRIQDRSLFGRYAVRLPETGTVREMAECIFPPGYAWRMEDLFQETQVNGRSQLIETISFHIYGKPHSKKCLRRIRSM